MDKVKVFINWVVVTEGGTKLLIGEPQHRGFPVTHENYEVAECITPRWSTDKPVPEATFKIKRFVGSLSHNLVEIWEVE